MPIPTKITPCPIVDATIGIFFETDMVADAIFGIVYNAFKDEYPDVERLPILQIPAEFRAKDKNLIMQPHYKIKSNKFILSIGPKGVSLVSWYLSKNIFAFFGKKENTKLRFTQQALE